MPKTHADFPDRLFFNCSVELRQTLVALSYLRGSGGSYAAPARDFLAEKVFDVISNLDARRKADYEEILKNIKLREQIKDNKKAPA